MAAFAPRPSFVDTAIITGRKLRSCDFAARVTVVSAIPFASFAIVLPVHGAITKASSIFFGPIGSASGIFSITPLSHISSIRFLKSADFPNLVSVSALLFENIGTIFTYFFRFSAAAITLENVQYDPVTAKPTVIFSAF